MNKSLSYQESLDRLKHDLKCLLENNKVTLAGYMDIENLQVLVNTNKVNPARIQQMIRMLDVYTGPDAVGYKLQSSDMHLLTSIMETLMEIADVHHD